MAKRWYSVSVLSNFEKKVAELINEAVEQEGMQDENAERENNREPKKRNEAKMKTMREQLKKLGLSIDWEKEISK